MTSYTSNPESNHCKMEGQDAVEIDPEIAAAMGFGSFGSQPKDKRKYHSENAYVDPSVSATGANSQTVVSAAKKATDEIDDDAPKDDSNQERGKHVTKNPSEATL